MSKLNVFSMGVKEGEGERRGGMGEEESSSRKIVNEWKGGERKRLEDREDSVAEQRWDSRSKTAIWWISLWMKGTSEGVARRILVKTGWPIGVVSGAAMEGSGAADGGGGGAAAAIGFGGACL